VITHEIDEFKSIPEDEADFLREYDPSEFDRPSLTVDLVLMTISEGCLKVALLRREQPPARGRLSLPGTFVGMDESLDDAAERVLATRLGLADTYLEQLYTFGAPQRDPRMRIVTVAYCALVAPERLEALPDPLLNLLTVVVPWRGETGGAVAVQSDEGLRPALAFDHAEIVGMAVKRLRGKLDYAPIGYQLLPEAFTLRRLQLVHETIRGESVNKDSFRRRMLASGDLIATGQLEDAVGHRPAELYRFARGSAV
jgi:8-oxo-dGTP diphosphatase